MCMSSVWFLRPFVVDEMCTYEVTAISLLRLCLRAYNKNHAMQLVDLVVLT